MKDKMIMTVILLGFLTCCIFVFIGAEIGYQSKTKEKYMTTKFDCSLEDTTVLRNLILENPDLPLIVFCGEEAYQDNGYAYSMANYSRGEIENLALYNNEVFLDEDDYREQLEDDLCENPEYLNLSDEEWDKMIDKKMTEVEFVKAIVLWVG